MLKYVQIEDMDKNADDTATALASEEIERISIIVTPQFKEDLRALAGSEHRSLSKQCLVMLESQYEAEMRQAKKLAKELAGRPRS